MKVALASLCLALTVVTVPSHAKPGTPEGATIVAAPTTCCPQVVSYTATVQGTWVFLGNWRLVILHGGTTHTYDSTQFVGGFRYGLAGAIQPGDRVTATLRSVGTVATFGSLTGCNNHAVCV